MMLAILTPVLNRPQNVRPLLESIEQSTPDAHVLFLCDSGDIAEQDAISKEEGRMLSPGGSYAAKIRAGIEATDTPLVFLGADDLRFRPGWLAAALACMVDGVQVVGVNDLIPRPHRPGHATHFLMTREAAVLPCLDGSPGPMFNYMAWRCDDELIATATKRGMYAYAPDSYVEHLHPMVSKAPDDATYQRGRAFARMDGKRFMRRAHLWT
jgi:glycosyltransferase involved in cell wall biosynthesis